MAGFILAPDLKRLAEFFVLNRRVEPAVEHPLFRSQGLNRAAVALQVAFGVVLLSYNLYQSDHRAKEAAAFRVTAPLYGIWSVDQFKLDGNTVTSPLPDQPNWQRVVFDSPLDGTVEPRRGPTQHCLTAFRSAKESLQHDCAGRTVLDR